MAGADHVEADRLNRKKRRKSKNLGEGAALANGDLVTKNHITESGGDVGRKVAVTLLKTVVLGKVVQVIPADNAGASALNLRQNIFYRFILRDVTTPVKMRPRMLTLPVKGHFLSM